MQDTGKTCRFQIPMDLHLMLHRHRVLTGQGISDTVHAALERYLDEKGL